jgi:hypothetical protein
MTTTHKNIETVLAGALRTDIEGTSTKLAKTTSTLGVRAKVLAAASALAGAVMLSGCAAYPVSSYPGYYGGYPSYSPYQGYRPMPAAPTYQQPPSNNGNGNYYPGYYPPAYSQPPAYQNGGQMPQSALPAYQQYQSASSSQYGSAAGSTVADNQGIISGVFRY